MDAEKFGAFIQERRKELGLTQSELAQRLHVTDKAISRWERAVGYPDIKLLEPLANALEISLLELLQSKRIDPLETEQDLEERTDELLEEHKKLSWQRRVILYLGYAVILMMGWVLVYVSHQAALPIYLRNVVYGIALVGVFFGSRALQFIVGRFWLKSKPWGIWHNSYAWISVTMIITGYILAKRAYQFQEPLWTAAALLVGICLFIGGVIYFLIKKEEQG